MKWGRIGSPNQNGRPKSEGKITFGLDDPNCMHVGQGTTPLPVSLPETLYFANKTLLRKDFQLSFWQNKQPPSFYYQRTESQTSTWFSFMILLPHQCRSPSPKKKSNFLLLQKGLKPRP